MTDAHSTDWIAIQGHYGPLVSCLIWVQTVAQGYQQKTKVVASAQHGKG